MNKPVMNLAMAILMSFGLVACSSSSDNGTDNLQEVGVSSTTTTTKTQIKNDKSDSASSNTRIINASSSASDSSTSSDTTSSDTNSSESSDTSSSDTNSSETSDTSSSTDSSSTDSSTTETADTTEADSIASSLVSSTFANDSSSQTYAYLQDEAKKVALLDQDGTCKENARCFNATHGVTTGTVLLTDKNSYSGYAVIREEYSSETSSTKPANSYIAIVTTPTTDKSVVVDATYTGNAVYTKNNLQPVAGWAYIEKKSKKEPKEPCCYHASLTLTVKDGTVSGSITNVIGKELVALNDSSILVGSNSVVFSGVATFNKVSGVSADGISGTYKGQFAGANAEEVVGVFETDTTVKADSVQGAFIGKKQ